MIYNKDKNLNKPSLTQQILGLCPLLAISSNLINSICLGIITTFVLSITNTLISLTRLIVFSEIRIPIYVMIISSVEGCIEMMMHAYIPNLYSSIGIFLPLIVTNCVIIGQAEAIASKKNFFQSLLNGLISGKNITITISIIGFLRELLGNGTIFYQAEYILGDWAKNFTVKIIEFNHPILIILLPPGAFIILGLLTAFNNFLIDYKKNFMNQKKIEKIFLRFKKIIPKPKTELFFNSQFELLIAVLLSAKSKDKTVNVVTKKLFSIANTPQQMIFLGEKNIKKKIKKIGFFNKKTEYIIKTCNIIINQYKNKIPSNINDLKKLPGIGQKSANVILNTAFGLPTIAVDTHVFRVTNRIGILHSNSITEVEKKLIKIIPKKLKYYCHNWLVLHGRYVCLYKKPKCKTCLINDLCEYDKKYIYNLY